MKVNRRTFLRLAGATAVGLASRPQQASATAPHPDGTGTLAILVDTTRCVGCRACEAACSESNGLPPPALPGDDAVFEAERPTSPEAYTVVNHVRGTAEGGAPAFVKKQCMHCLQPACASACLVSALEKTADGPVVYHEERCIGCRYCMVACPFGIPQFEYSKPLPYVRKCTFCRDRLARGKDPACTSVCPSGALQFGTRAELLEVAKARIYQTPGRYVRHVYGEHEAGGTSVLYLGGVPFERLGFSPDVGTTPYPQLTWPFLSAVPFVLTLWPPFLIGLHAFARSRETAAGAEAGPKEEPRHE